MDMWYDMFEVQEPQVNAEPKRWLDRKRKHAEIMKMNTKRNRDARSSPRK